MYWVISVGICCGLGIGLLGLLGYRADEGYEQLSDLEAVRALLHYSTKKISEAEAIEFVARNRRRADEEKIPSDESVLALDRSSGEIFYLPLYHFSTEK